MILKDEDSVMHPCINWEGKIMYKGYGIVYDPVIKKSKFVHRKIWEDVNGPIPPGMLVCHRCDNRKCKNIDHLFLGTPKDNTQDMIKKGRNRVTHEFTNANCKLSNKEVIDIRNLYKTGTYTHRSLAKKYNVNHSLIGRIIRREERKSV